MPLRLALPICLVVLGAGSALGQKPGAPIGEAAVREAQLLEQMAAGSLASRRKAVVAARALATPEVVARVTALAQSDEHVALRQAAIESLGYFPQGDGTAVLLGLHEGLGSAPESARLVAAVCEALGRRRAPGAFDLLVARLGADRIVTAGAAAGLGLLSDPRAYDPLLRALRPFQLTLRHGLPLLEAMLACDRKRAIAFFVEGMGDPETPQPYRLRFELLLRASPGDDVATAARTLLGSTFPDAVERGVRILGACRRVNDIPLVTKILHGAPEHRRACVQALVLFGHDLTVDDLSRYLDDPFPRIRADVAQGLGAIGSKRSVPTLVARLAAEPDLRARLRIVEALGRIGDPRAVSALVPLLEDRSLAADPQLSSMRSQFPGNTETRYAVLWALQRIRDGKAAFDLRLRNAAQWEAAAPAAEFAAWQAWWKEHGSDVRYRVGS